MGKQILSLGASSLLLFGSLQSVVTVECQDAAKQQTSAPTVRAPQPNGKETSLLPGQFILQDATPILLRIIRNVSSADAHVGDSVDFEVLEDVAVNGILVIPKGSVAVGTVTEVQSKRRMGRAGKLEIVLDYVRLADTDKAAIRAVKDAKKNWPAWDQDIPMLLLRRDGVGRWRGLAISPREERQSVTYDTICGLILSADAP